MAAANHPGSFHASGKASEASDHLAQRPILAKPYRAEMPLALFSLPSPRFLLIPPISPLISVSSHYFSSKKTQSILRRIALGLFFILFAMFALRAFLILETEKSEEIILGGWTLYGRDVPRRDDGSLPAWVFANPFCKPTSLMISDATPGFECTAFSGSIKSIHIFIWNTSTECDLSWMSKFPTIENIAYEGKMEDDRCLNFLFDGASLQNVFMAVKTEQDFSSYEMPNISNRIESIEINGLNLGDPFVRSLQKCRKLNGLFISDSSPISQKQFNLKHWPCLRHTEINVRREDQYFFDSLEQTHEGLFFTAKDQ